MRFSTLLQPSRIALAAVVFGLTALITVALQETVRALVVEPIARLAWLLGLVIGIVPQRVLLLGIVGFGAFAVALAVLERDDLMPPRAYRAPLEGELTALTGWMHHTQYAAGSFFSAQRITTELRRILCFELLGAADGDAVRTLVDRVREGALTVPPDVGDVVLGTPEWMQGRTRVPMPGWFARTAERAGVNLTREWTPASLDRLRGVVAYLESLDNTE
jgi:hypothetical protein